MALRKFISLIWGIWFVFACFCGVAQNSPPSEYQLKAAFIYNFAKFIDWPAESFSDDKAPFIIGILGENPFGEHLARTIAGRDVDAHPIEIKRLRNISESRNCHLLFIANSMAAKMPEILKTLKDAPVLTVGESESFIHAGGMVRFVDDAKKIRFQINADAAKAVRIKISSKLLTLALPLNP